MRDTKKRFSFSLANVSRVFRIFYERSLHVFVIWHEKILICGRERNESVVSRERESHVFFFEISLSFFFVCGQLNFSLASLKIALLLCRRSEKKLYSCVFLGDFIVVCMFAAFARGSFLTSITRRVSRRRAERS